MTEPSPTAIEQTLQRYGDDLYRLALLLAPDARRAGALVVAAARRACVGPTPPDEPQLLGALVAALPPAGSRQDRPPSDLARAALRPVDGPVLAALARLPRRQRLALGLLLLREYDPERAAAVSGSDAEQVRRQLRDALVALAPQIAPELPPEHLDEESAPEGCQPTRRALALNSAQLHSDPAIRGHLALCPECRAAERSWEQLSARVEEALRYTLREVVLPGALIEEAQAPPRARLLARGRALLARPWLRLALVPLAVLGLIGALVLPRARPASTPTAGPPPASQSPRALAAQALERLYTPPGGGRGVWHGRWQMRWDFNSAVYASLNGDLWLDPARGRHRVQLVHQEGGGPYEFQVADGERRLVYAATDLYAESVTPGMVPAKLSPLNFQATSEQQGRALAARLDAGPWGLAARYLRQAAAAPDLKSWGRQRDSDGAMLEVLGFRGFSPLGLPPGASDAPSEPATLLLSIDSASGALREVRELTGPAGSEQIGRTTWRFLGGEWIDSLEKADQTLDPARAWNGASPLSGRSQPLVSPDFPLVPASTVQPLAHVLLENWAWPPVPAQMPAGVRAGVVSTSVDDNTRGQRIVAYAGEGRVLVIAKLWTPGSAELRLSGPLEQLSVADMRVQLRAAVGQRYQVLVGATSGAPSLSLSTQGYTRAEVIDLVKRLRPLGLEIFRSQRPIFAEPRPDHPQAQELLLAMLDEASQQRGGQVRHTVQRVFSRRNNVVSPLRDPYHAPLFGGVPEQTRHEQWERQGDAGRELVATTSSITDTNLRFEQSYQSADQSWSYQPVLDQLQFYDPTDVGAQSYWVRLALHLLSCGGIGFERAADGSAIVRHVQSDWHARVCQPDNYSIIWSNQYESGPWEAQPYLADLDTEELSTWLYFSPAGQLRRLERRAGPTPQSMLLEAREIVSDEWLPAASVAPALFDPQPPNALVVQRYSQSGAAPASQQSLTLAQATRAMPTPLWALPPSAPDRAPPSDAPVVELRDINRVDGFNGPASPENPLLDAFLRGLALRLSYTIHVSGGSIPLEIYEGPADRLGRYLSTQARWRSSVSTVQNIGGQASTVWQMTALSGDVWLVFERDGTIIAADARSTDQIAILSQLQAVSR